MLYSLDFTYDELTHVEASTRVALKIFTDLYSFEGGADLAKDISELTALTSKITSKLDEIDKMKEN
jgi:hypothetical protein